MSVVNLLIHDSFALIMGDTKLSNNPNKDIIKKVFQKDGILFGYTGTIKDVAEYLHPMLTNDLLPNDTYTWGIPMDFFDFLDKKFYLAIENNIEKDVIFVVAAKIGEKYIAKYYCLSNSNGHCWRTETLISDNKIQYYYLGDISHKNYFKQKIDSVPSVTIKDLTDMFQDTLDYGIQYDM